MPERITQADHATSNPFHILNTVLQLILGYDPTSSSQVRVARIIENDLTAKARPSCVRSNSTEGLHIVLLGKTEPQCLLAPDLYPNASRRAAKLMEAIAMDIPALRVRAEKCEAVFR